MDIYFKEFAIRVSMQNILAINGSPNSYGSTAKALNAVAEEMMVGDYSTEVVNLGELNIAHCRACMNCKKTGECAIVDDMVPLYEKIREADVLIFGTPVYFGAETGLFKNFLDRMYAMIQIKNGVRTPEFGRPKKGSVMLTCGAPDGDMMYHGVVTHLLSLLRSFGISDVTSAIIPKANPETIFELPQYDDYVGALEFQLL